MDSVSAFRVCLRRWYVFVPILALGLLTMAQVYQSASSVWTAQVSLVVLPSSRQVVQGETVQINPYTTGASSARLLTAALAANLNSGPLQRDAGLPGASFAAAAARNDPVVTITVTASDEQAAASLAGSMLRLSQTQLRVLQQGVGAPAASILTADYFAPLDAPSETRPTRAKFVVALLALAAAAAVAAAVLADGLVRVMSRRRTGQRLASSPLHVSALQD